MVYSIPNKRGLITIDEITDNKTVFEKLIDWFIELKDEETFNTINLFTENIDLILDKQKVLKK